ncbi:hypothetical protein RYB68_28695, partial [Pseudomonas syringae pv. actinidiae]|nr:hypothetical protein [Pseudomonas syringae pv. actinidiae]
NRPKRDPLELGKNEPTFYAMMIGFQPYCSLSYRLHFCVKASKRQSVKASKRYNSLACAMNEDYDCLR